MTEFINRFINIRGVIKNVYMQINEVGEFLEHRSRSLGKDPRKTMGQWRSRSHDMYTHTWEYERNDYITEVSDIDAMQYDVEGVLQFIENIYSDLLKLIHCDPYLKTRIAETDDPDEDIIEMLNPQVCLDGLDDAMANDHDLGCIAERIYYVIKFGWSEHGNPQLFHIRGTREIYQVLHDNKFSTFQRPHSV